MTDKNPSVKRINKLIENLPKENEAHKLQFVTTNVDNEPTSYIPDEIKRNITSIEKDKDQYKINTLVATSENKHIKTSKQSEKEQN